MKMFEDFVFSFIAGVIAFFSPCAFPMLPAYISYYLASKKEGIKNGLLGGLICAAGAVSILLIIGSIISFAGEEIGGAIKENTQNIEIVVAVIIILLGISMLLGKTIKFSVPVQASKKEGYTGLFIYGILYALAALGCTAPIFISIMLRAFSSFNFVYGLFLSFIYSVGIAIFIVGVTLAVSMAKDVILDKAKNLLKYIERIGGAIVIIAGIYILVYALT
ncbi:MAG: hypothetical protein DRN29_07640 [Thermoplasmata archaeon]|nr:MAG: hypothetical protein DRN29_07640 [Thermoplasmata archaeon]